MLPHDDLSRAVTEAESLEQAAAVLEELLGGGYSVWADGTLYFIKQLVERVNGLQIHVYPNEHPPPHFHVKSPNVDASFTVSDCRLLHGKIDGRQASLVQWWYERARPKVVEAWNASRPTDCPIGPIS